MSAHMSFDREPEDDAFFRDWMTGRHYSRQYPPGYHQLVTTPDPDLERLRTIQAIEERVAEGILRWLERQKPGFAYDYWLIYFGLADDGPGSTETWPKLRLRLWADMDARKWLDTRDCYSSKDRLWVVAVSIVYSKLFPGRNA